MRIAFVSSSLPRRCGIATFTSDLMAATRAADPDLSTWVAAIDEPNVVRPYEREVRWRIRQGHPNSYRAAAAAISDSQVDVVNVQHEFGLYGTWHMAETESVYEDHLRPFLEELRKPVVTTLHSVPSEPSPSMREAVLSIVELSQQVVVMAATAVDLLATDYGVQEPPIVIPHGMPAIEPHGRIRIKAKLGLQDRTIISTFGLVDPRKGLEYMVEAMPDVGARHPNALYLIAGQTHPNLLRSQGERYRNSLVDTVKRLGLRDHVSFIDQYMAQRDVIDLLLASDVYVTPYLDPRQITSGTLAYAMGAGKAIVSTEYLHAKEALGDGRGILIGFRNAEQLASAVNSILTSGERKQTLERMAYSYAREMTWPKLGRRWVELMRRAAATDTTRPRPREARTGAERHSGSPASPASIAAIVPTMEAVATEVPEDKRSSPGMPPDIMPSLMTHGKP